LERKNNFDPGVLQCVGANQLLGCSPNLKFSTDVLDGAMVTLAIYTLNFAHPGVLLRDFGNINEKASGSSIRVV
jgi:hypothetical protein